MIAALKGIIDDDDIARLPVAEFVQDGVNAGRHRAQMRRNVRGLGNHAAMAPSKSAHEKSSRSLILGE